MQFWINLVRKLIFEDTSDLKWTDLLIGWIEYIYKNAIWGFFFNCYLKLYFTSWLKIKQIDGMIFNEEYF